MVGTFFCLFSFEDEERKASLENCLASSSWYRERRHNNQQYGSMASWEFFHRRFAFYRPDGIFGDSDHFCSGLAAM